MSWEPMSYVVTLVGLPPAILVFVHGEHPGFVRYVERLAESPQA